MSVYCSPSGDLLVGMTKIASTNRIGKVTRYSSTGQTSQTIPADDIKDVWFKIPKYVTENNNGDIVVSDFWRGVVVIERGGELRFFFEGSNSKLRPYGICTDELSNILVCDSETNTVQIIDKDGQFLAYLLTLKSPRSLSYDVKNHSLWVGSFKSVSMYIYMDRDFDLIGKNTQFQYWSFVILVQSRMFNQRYLYIIIKRSIVTKYIRLIIIFFPKQTTILLQKGCNSVA